MTQQPARRPVRFAVLAVAVVAALTGGIAWIAMRQRDEAPQTSSSPKAAGSASDAPRLTDTTTPAAPPRRRASAFDVADAAADGATRTRATTPETEAAAMARLRSLVGTDPERAVALAAELDGRSAPDSPHAEERSTLAIDALVKLGKIGKARSRAVEHYRRFPAGAHVEHIERLTGAHPRPATPDAAAARRTGGDRRP